MKIAIFGGTFDPPHNEHRSIAEHVLSELKPDRLIVMPAKLPPHKRREGVSRAKDRAEMAKLAFSGLDGVEFSDFEMRQRGPSYTYRTLQYFRKRYPGDELVFVIGSDSLRDFFSWRSPKKIAELATIAVCRRRGAGSLARAVKTFEKRTGKSPVLLDYAGADLSSTELKVLIAYGIDVSSWVPEEVLGFIRKKRLYRERNAFIQSTKEFLTEKRYRHTAFTVAEAMILARRAGADPEKAFTAAALHDIAKKFSDEQLAAFGFVRDSEMPDPVVHAFAGAYLAEKCFGVTDPEILDAIRYHTTGRPAMTQLEKVIYTADCVEKSRAYEGVRGFRRAVEHSFERGFVACLKGTMELLERENRMAVSKQAAQAYEYYKESGEKK